jgi:hypothetical protein
LWDTLVGGVAAGIAPEAFVSEPDASKLWNSSVIGPELQFMAANGCNLSVTL